MNFPPLGSSTKTDRVDSGEGRVHNRSLELGDTVVVFRNIGTITLLDGKNEAWPYIASVILGIVGLVILLSPLKLPAILLICCAAGLFFWATQRKPDIFLSLGTADGRRTNIVSKDKEGLVALRNLLRDKIEDIAVTSTRFTVTADKITFPGAMNFAPNSTVLGASARQTLGVKDETGCW